jgi:hypothetical protein
MVDGDATYDAASVTRLVDRLIDDRLDMVVGCRRTRTRKRAPPTGAAISSAIAC